MIKHFKRFAYLGGIYSVSSIFEKSILFFFIPIYTAYVGTYELGIINLLAITAEITSKLITAPIINGFIRYYHAPSYSDKKGLFLFNSVLFLAVQALILSTAFFVLRYKISNVLLDTDIYAGVVKVYAFILFFDVLSSLLTGYLKQDERARYLLFVSWGSLIISGCVLICGLLIFKMGFLSMVYSVLVSQIVTTLCIIPIWWKNSTPKISLAILKQPLKYGYPLTISSMSNSLIQDGDRYVIGMFLGTASVGLYSFGYNMAGILNVALVIPVKMALQPIFFKQESTPNEQRRFLRKSCTYYYLIGMFLCLILALFSREIVEVMARKKEYLGSWIIIPLIAFAYLQQGLGNFVGLGAVMAEKALYMGAHVVIAAAVNIGLNFVFVPLWGVMGAAIATLISYFVWNALKLYYSARFYDLHFELGRMVYITGVGVVLYLMSFLLVSNISTVSNIVIKAGLVIAYPFIFFLLPFFSFREREYICKLFRLKKLSEARQV